MSTLAADRVASRGRHRPGARVGSGVCLRTGHGQARVPGRRPGGDVADAALRARRRSSSGSSSGCSRRPLPAPPRRRARARLRARVLRGAGAAAVLGGQPHRSGAWRSSCSTCSRRCSSCPSVWLGRDRFCVAARGGDPCCADGRGARADRARASARSMRSAPRSPCSPRSPTWPSSWPAITSPWAPTRVVLAALMATGAIPTFIFYGADHRRPVAGVPDRPAGSGSSASRSSA